MTEIALGHSVGVIGRMAQGVVLMAQGPDQKLTVNPEQYGGSGLGCLLLWQNWFPEDSQFRSQ